MRRAAGALLALLLAGCSKATTFDGGIAAVEIRVPVPAQVLVGDTLPLTARALDAAGDSVAAALEWRTPDSTITVGLTTGKVVGVLPGFSGRVQVTAGGVTSDFVTIVVTSPPVTP